MWEILLNVNTNFELLNIKLWRARFFWAHYQNESTKCVFLMVESLQLNGITLRVCCYINVNNMMLLPNANIDLIILNFIMVQKWQIKWQRTCEGVKYVHSTSESLAQFYILRSCLSATIIFLVLLPIFFRLIQRLLACKIEWNYKACLTIEHMLQMNHTQRLIQRMHRLVFDDNQFTINKRILCIINESLSLSMCNVCQRHSRHEFIALFKDVNGTISIESWHDHNSIVWSWIIRIPRMQRKYSSRNVLICVLSLNRVEYDEIQVECKTITISSCMKLTFNF